MRRFATVVTGSLALASSAGLAVGARFDEALGVSTPGVVVQAAKADPHARMRENRGALATDTHDAVVSALTIDDRLLAEGLIHSTIEGPIGPDDPSVTGEIRLRPRVAAKPAPLADGEAAERARAMQASHEAAAPRESEDALDAEEPLLITDRVTDAEALQPAEGWVDRCKSAFSRMFKRTH